ncbi:MAG: 5-formyltetrahydrofolate cyclo-ligase [Gammaproteobacteria bacterium]|nr:5-formyltetrahydrofolate cyclo-ligase [Gammaproteobacteria bacterium]
MTARAQIRKRIRAQRRQLSPQQRRAAAVAIATRLRQTAIFFRSRRIAGFIANDGEPDLTPLMHYAWTLGKDWHLPVIGLPSTHQLWFAPYDGDNSLHLNRFGIPEPAVSIAKTTRPWGLDLILLPLVAFDQHGNRLGMGKGYYDRTLQYLLQRQHWHKPRLIGVAYEFQKLKSITAESWDVPLDGIVTERGFYPTYRR